MTTLAERLAGLRAAAKLNNAELDRLAGLRKGHSRALELKDSPNPELKTLQSLAAALGATVGYLANGEGDAPSDEEIGKAVFAARAKREPDTQVEPLEAAEPPTPLPPLEEAPTLPDAPLTLVGNEPPTPTPVG